MVRRAAWLLMGVVLLGASCSSADELRTSDDAHADFWNVWDQAKLEREVDVCINRSAVCTVST